MLLANLVEMRRSALPGLRRWNYRVNETVSLRAPRPDPADVADLVVVGPDGSQRTLVRDRNDIVEITRLRSPGVYRIEEQDEPRGAGRARGHLDVGDLPICWQAVEQRAVEFGTDLEWAEDSTVTPREQALQDEVGISAGRGQRAIRRAVGFELSIEIAERPALAGRDVNQTHAIAVGRERLLPALEEGRGGHRVAAAQMINGESDLGNRHFCPAKTSA